jgi:DNA polymerase-3 subunit epsilon
MRLGLLDRPVDVEDILQGRSMARTRRAALTAKISHARRQAFLNGPEPQTRGVHPRVVHPMRVPARPEPRFVYLDTETTGTSYRSRIVEIAIVDDQGNALLNTLVDPEVAIPAKATALHGITDQMVSGYPTIDILEPLIEQAVQGCYVVIFNARFDMMFLSERIKRAMEAAVCCKEKCDAYNAEVDWYGKLVGSNLIRAAAAVGFTWPNPPHRALPDALAARAVWRFLMKHHRRGRRIPVAFSGP